MPGYGSSPISYHSEVQLAVAYCETQKDNTGSIVSTGWWNHETGGYEYVPRDDAKHLLPLQRLATDGVDNSIQLFYASRDAIGGSKAVTTIIYATGAGGVPSEIKETLQRNYVYICAGLDT